MAGIGLRISDEKIFDEFSKIVDKRGYTKYRAVEAALRAFIALPEEAQVKLMSNEMEPEIVLIDTFREKALEYDLSKLSPAQRVKVIALVKEAAKSISRKK